MRGDTFFKKGDNGKDDIEAWITVDGELYIEVTEAHREERASILLTPLIVKELFNYLKRELGLARAEDWEAVVSIIKEEGDEQ